MTTTQAHAPYPEGDPVRIRFTVHTHSGSVYRLGEHASAGWVYSAKNLATERSQSVPVGWWPIEAPTDPLEGERLVIHARASAAPDHATGHPRAGKITSLVTRVIRHRAAQPTADLPHTIPQPLEP